MIFLMILNDIFCHLSNNYFHKITLLLRLEVISPENGQINILSLKLILLAHKS